MRGVGFLMPCDLNSDSNVSRGTVSTLTERPRRWAKVDAISFRVTRCCQLRKDGTDVEFHRVLRNVEPVRNVLVSKPLSHQRQDFELSFSQGFKRSFIFRLNTVCSGN